LPSLYKTSMTDSLRQDGIKPAVNTLLSACAKSVEISRTSREMTLLGILSKPRALFYSSCLKISLIFSLITSRFICRVLLSCGGLVRISGVSDDKRKNFLTRILVRI
jgi:hypothetical protein